MHTQKPCYFYKLLYKIYYSATFDINKIYGKVDHILNGITSKPSQAMKF